MKAMRRKTPAPRGPLGLDRRRIAEIVPPEGVPLHFEVARLGARLAAQIIDILLTLGPVIVIVLLLGLAGLAGLAGMATLTIVAALLFFFVRAPYYVATELLWNGQTLGKRISRLRVISGNGRSLSVYQVVARNLMKELEVFVPASYVVAGSSLAPAEAAIVLAWVGGLIAVPLFSKRRQRLGDIIADTIVIHQPEQVLTPDLAVAAAREAVVQRFVFLPHQLDHYGAFELQVLEKVLHGGAAPGSGRLQREADLAAIFDRIRAKIGYTDRVERRDIEDFLRAFYVAQRAHLERRQLYGDVRADKFHKERTSEEAS